MAEKVRNIILIIERDNFKRDVFIDELVNQVSQLGYEVVWHKRIKSLLDPDGRFLRLPKFVRWIVKILKFVVSPEIWVYHFGLFSNDSTISERCIYLKKHIVALGKKNNIIVLSRSAGGLVASLVADELNIKKVVCLGYPFKKPGEVPEPHRYMHLSFIRTPMLIIQGTDDEYGGLGVTAEYKLSPQITCEFIKTDHDFRLTGEQWIVVHNDIVNFISNTTVKRMVQPPVFN